MKHGQAITWALENSQIFRWLVSGLDLKKREYSHAEVTRLLRALAMAVHHVDELRDGLAHPEALHQRVQRILTNFEKAAREEARTAETTSRTKAEHKEARGTGAAGSDDHQGRPAGQSEAVAAEGTGDPCARKRTRRRSDRFTPHWAIHA